MNVNAFEILGRKLWVKYYAQSFAESTKYIVTFHKLHWMRQLDNKRRLLVLLFVMCKFLPLNIFEVKGSDCSDSVQSSGY